MTLDRAALRALLTDKDKHLYLATYVPALESAVLQLLDALEQVEADYEAANYLAEQTSKEWKDVKAKLATSEARVATTRQKLTEAVMLLATVMTTEKVNWVTEWQQEYEQLETFLDQTDPAQEATLGPARASSSP